MNKDPVEDLYSPIGALTVAFSQLEERIIWLISALIGEDLDVGEIICSQLSFRQLLSVLDGLYRKKVDDVELIKHLEWIVKSSGSCEQYRNKIVHSIYRGHHLDLTVVQEKKKIKVGKGFQLDSSPANPEEISQAAKEIADMSGYIRDFVFMTHKKGYIKPFQILELIPDEYL